MIPKERIPELNAKFQKSYYDADLGFFRIVVPGMLDEIKVLISTFIEKNPAMANTLGHYLNNLEYEYEEVNRLNAMPRTSSAVKDNYLNSMKNNISHILWGFHDDILRNDARMLEKVI